MSAVLRVVVDGKIVRQCDSKCHDAEKPDCDCICGGKNHGFGYGHAIKAVRDGRDNVSPSVHELLCTPGVRLEIVPLYVQNSLF